MLEWDSSVQYSHASSTLHAAAAAGVTFQVAKVDGVQHKDGGSHVVCSDGTRIRGCMVLDATGHARKLVEYDKPFDPGYQVSILTHPPGMGCNMSSLLNTRYCSSPFVNSSMQGCRTACRAMLEMHHRPKTLLAVLGLQGCGRQHRAGSLNVQWLVCCAMSWVGWPSWLLCLCREHMGSWLRWRATPLPQTRCYSWTGGTITQRQTRRCRKATGMQKSQIFFAETQCYSYPLWILHLEAEQRGW